MHARCFFTNKWFRRSCFSICIGFEDLCSEGFPACRDPTFIVLMYFQWKHYTRVPLNPFHSSTRSTTRLWKRTNKRLDLKLLHKTLKMDRKPSSLLPIIFIKCNYADCIFNLCPFFGDYVTVHWVCRGRWLGKLTILSWRPWWEIGRDEMEGKILFIMISINIYRIQHHHYQKFIPIKIIITLSSPQKVSRIEND